MSNNSQPYNKWNYKTKQILGFFVSKGLLIVPEIAPAPTAKLDIEDVVKFGLETEPRILEVLPAALLHFPRSFQHRNKMPQKVKDVIAAIKQSSESGPDLAGIPYIAMKRWADKALNDRRTIPEIARKIMKSYRLSKAAVFSLKAKARQVNKTETEVLEELILSRCCQK